ncbi:MAG: cytochrome c oxidase assembly protein, partial [Alphaproteobacteria bacterium]
RMITVRFDSNVNSSLPWKFKPAQKEITLPVGSESLARYTAVNTSDETIIGTATFNVTPYKAAEYFNKVECFCFTEQKLAPGEEASLPVTFFVDPEIFNDPIARDVRTITLSYTFYRDPDDAKRAKAKKAKQTAAKNKTDSRS